MKESTVKEQINISMKLPNIDIKQSAGKRSIWVNFEKMAIALGRPKEHLFNFIKDELRYEGTLGGKGELNFKTNGIVTEKMAKNTITKYINDYIKCPVCKSYNTQLKKDQSTRLLQIYCEDCKGQRTIQPIKTRAGDAKKKK